MTPSTLPSGLTQSFPALFTNNRTTTFSLVDGQSYTAADVGYKPSATTATFGDLVWVDANNNGARDAGEIGISGVTVRLYQDSDGDGVVDVGEPFVVTTTAPDGSYLFTGVTASGTQDYIVFVDATQALLVGYTATTPTIRSYPDVSGGGAYLNADFGFRANGVTTYTLQDRVWLDADGDGVLDAGETGIGGVTMELLNASLQVIGTTTTAADGTFTFSGLAGGGADYTTRITDTSGVLVNYYGTTSYSGGTTRREQPGRQPGPHDRAQLRLPGLAQPRRHDLLRPHANGVQDASDNGIAGLVVSLYRDTNDDGTIDAGEPLVWGRSRRTRAGCPSSRGCRTTGTS